MCANSHESRSFPVHAHATAYSQHLGCEFLLEPLLILDNPSGTLTGNLGIDKVGDLQWRGEKGGVCVIFGNPFSASFFGKRELLRKSKGRRKRKEARKGKAIENKEERQRGSGNE
jgi:hypothetical protein